MQTSAADTSEPAFVASAPSSSRDAGGTVFAVIMAVSFSHLLNDTIQALLPSIYPMLKDDHRLTFTQLGLITLTFQVTASLLQPFVGYWTDRHPSPRALPFGMCLTLVGLVALAYAGDFAHIIVASVFIGAGSAIFHPAASRVAYLAAGSRRGLAQSLFQVGGNAGSAVGPLLAALVVVPRGQRAVLAFCVFALAGVFVLSRVGRWQKQQLRLASRRPASAAPAAAPYPRRVVLGAIAVLLALTFSKYVYLSSITSYYTFYLIERFGVSVQNAQYLLFVFLAATAAGTILGGPIGDRFGRKRVIWASILGVAPFSLWLPHADLAVTAALSVVIGLVLASAFSAILVYAQELMPGKVGMVAGLFFGFAFGMAGIGSAVLGKVADLHGIDFVFHVCAFLPLIGLLTVFLPNVERNGA